MILKEFEPNYIKNKGKSFEKVTAKKEQPAPERKRTVIPNAIKTADEVAGRLAKAKGKAKGSGKAKAAGGRAVSSLPPASRLARVSQAPRPVQKQGRK